MSDMRWNVVVYRWKSDDVSLSLCEYEICSRVFVLVCVCVCVCLMYFMENKVQYFIEKE